MIGDILLKVVNGQSLTQAEKDELLNLNYIDIAKPPVRDLSQISEDLGHVRLGSVICGTGDPFDQASGNFTGMGIFNPPITTAAGDFNLVGMNAGTLEAGISAADGKFYAGGGEVVLDADGINLSLQPTITYGKSSVKWIDGTNTPVYIQGARVPNSLTTLQVNVQTLSSTEDATILLSTQQNLSSPVQAAFIYIDSAPGISLVEINATSIRQHGAVIIDGFGASLTLNDRSVDTFLATGWINDASTWTYASASTFTVSGDQTARFTKGTRLNWTQTTVKYGVVASSSYSSGTGLTTVTIVVNTNYVISNAAITLPYYSNLAAPVGWPGWFNYATTLAWTAGTAPSGTPTTNLAMFNIYGTTCQVSIFKAGFTAGATVTGVTATLPVPASPVAQNGYGLIRAANAPNTCISYINTTANIFCASAAATAMHFSATYEW